MKINTKFHGEITVESVDVLYFEKGLPGFKDEKYFTLLQLGETKFKVLQSLTNSTVAFILVVPWLFEEKYEFVLSEPIVSALNVESSNDVEVYSIVSVGLDNGDMTINLLAPIVINVVLNKGIQFVLHGTDYQVKHKIGMGE